MLEQNHFRSKVVILGWEEAGTEKKLFKKATESSVF